MNNMEIYKKTFSRLHASGSLDLEVMEMKKRGTGFRCRRSLLVLTSVMTVMLAMSAIAYAATGGKIVDRVKVWLGSESVDLQEGEIIQNEDGEFVIKIDGKTYKANTVNEESAAQQSAD